MLKLAGPLPSASTAGFCWMPPTGGPGFHFQESARVPHPCPPLLRTGWETTQMHGSPPTLGAPARQSRVRDGIRKSSDSSLGNHD